MTSSVHLITGNIHKFSELANSLCCLVQVDIDLPEIQAIDSRDVIAAKLAEARVRQPNRAILVEDTALHLSCLNGFPGALIKWMLDRVKCQGIYDLCQRMGDTRAEARTVLGFLAEDSDTPLFFNDTIEGAISPPRGTNGFGWDPIFIPAGSAKTFAEMDMAEKMAFSMRRKAAEKLARYLTEQGQDLRSAATPASE